MKTYKRKFAQTAIRRSMATRKETRDGILWYVDVSNKLCRLKIQGSDKLIVAHYPRNQKVIPTWLRIGNSVRIVHREGIRGYLEVIGEGRAIPSPVSGATFPDSGSLSDGILSGMVMYPIDPPRNSVFVSNGTYRINGITYSFTGYDGYTYIVMNDPAPMVMGVLPIYKMGIIVLNLDEAPSVGWFRYDAYVVGADGIPDYIKGVEVSSNPEKPAIPANHILIRYVLRVGGDSVVVDYENIGIDYVVPKPVVLVFTIPDEQVWTTLEINLKVEIKNNYGNAISSSDGWLLSLSLLTGTGQVWSADDGYSDTEVTQQLFSVSEYTFKYKRDTSDTETSPIFQFLLNTRPPIYGFDTTILLDVGGDPV